MEKRLFRNEHDKVVAGVSSGLAEYMQVDITVIRVLFVLSTFFLVGAGLLVYMVMWIVVPVNNDPLVRYRKFNDYFNKAQQNNPFHTPNAFNETESTADQTKWNTPNVEPEVKANSFTNVNPQQKGSDTGRTIGGLILLLLGFYFLLREFDIIPHWFNIFKIYKLWPLAIIAIGVSLIFRNQRKTEWEKFKKTTAEAQQDAANKPVVADTVVEEEKEPNA